MTAKGAYVPVTPAQRWGNALRGAMKARGYSVNRLASETGVSRHAVTGWRTGRQFPRYAYALRVAEVLMWDQLVVIAQETHEKTCALEGCDRTFIDITRTRHQRYCTRRHAHAAERRAAGRQRRVGAFADGKLRTETIKRYQRAVDAFCRACGIDACPDAQCPIQVAGLSPLPLADERLRIA